VAEIQLESHQKHENQQPDLAERIQMAQAIGWEEIGGYGRRQPTKE
jgi:hypothetical protein